MRRSGESTYVECDPQQVGDGLPRSGEGWVNEGTSVTVVGDGAVGLPAVLSADPRRHRGRRAHARVRAGLRCPPPRWHDQPRRRPQYEEAPIGFGSLFGGNITLTGGPAPVRAYIEELLPHVLNGTIEPGKVFDHTVDLEGVLDGYRAMDERKSIKVLIDPR